MLTRDFSWQEEEEFSCARAPPPPPSKEPDAAGEDDTSSSRASSCCGDLGDLSEEASEGADGAGSVREGGALQATREQAAAAARASLAGYLAELSSRRGSEGTEPLVQFPEGFLAMVRHLLVGRQLECAGARGWLAHAAPPPAQEAGLAGLAGPVGSTADAKLREALAKMRALDAQLDAATRKAGGGRATAAAAQGGAPAASLEEAMARRRRAVRHAGRVRRALRDVQLGGEGGAGGAGGGPAEGAADCSAVLPPEQQVLLDRVLAGGDDEGPVGCDPFCEGQQLLHEVEAALAALGGGMGGTNARGEAVTQGEGGDYLRERRAEQERAARLREIDAALRALDP